MRTLLLTGAVTFPVLAALLPAQTIVVSGGGTALQQAISTAPVGAILDVMPGTYSPVVVTQGMRISLRPGVAVTSALAAPPFPTTTPGMTISSLPAGQQLVVEGSASVTTLAIHSCAGDVVVNGINHEWYPLGPSATTVTACTGAVIFHRTTCVTMDIPHGTIQVTSCAHVSFTACRVPCMRVASSRVSLNGSSNLHAYGSMPGIDVVSGSVVVDGGNIEGGTLYSMPWPAPGIRLAQGEVVVTGGAVIRYTPMYPLPYNAIETAGGSMRLDPSVQVIGAITGPATIQNGEIPSLAVSHNAMTLAVALTGEPGSAIFTLAGLPMSPVPTPWGDAWLSPADPILNVVVLSASGASGFSYPLANVPPFATLVVQSVALSTTGALVVGAPARIAWD